MRPLAHGKPIIGATPAISPGSTSNSLSVVIASTTSIIIAEATPPYPIGSLTIGSTIANVSTAQMSVTLNGTGSLVVNGDLTVEQTLILGSGLRLVVNGNIRGSSPILLSNGSFLRLTSTSTTAIQSSMRIAAANIASFGGTVDLGARFNAGFLPGAVFGSAEQPFSGILRIGGTFTLSSPLFIGTNGVFDFAAESSKHLILASSATILGSVLNAGARNYFVTAPFPLTLGNVGSVTFPIGPSALVFSPISITNNGVPASFSARALPTVQQTPALATGSTSLRQSIVNQQWNVTQVTGLTPGAVISVAPIWSSPAHEGAGFNNRIAVTNLYTTTSGTISTSPGPAATDPTFPGYRRSSVTFTQIASNNLNDTPVLVTSQPAPGAITYTPTSPSSGGTMTILGSRFAPGASVSIGGVVVPASATTVISGGSSGIDTIRVVVPSNFRSGDVTVTQTGGSATASAFCFSCNSGLQSPKIISVTPNPAPGGIGDVQVAITGSAFGTNTLRVVATGSGITSTIVPSSSSTTRIVATVPGAVVRVVGTVTLTVTSVDRLAVSTTITISSAPSIILTSLTPSVTSSNLQPFLISVHGNYFSAQSVFTLGEYRLRIRSVSRNADGSLTAIVEAPPGVQSGNLTVTNLNLQTASLPFVVGTVGVESALPSQTRIFPNPADDIVTIETNLARAAILHIKLINSSGQCVRQAEHLTNAGLSRWTLDVSSMLTGAYIVEVSNEAGERLTQKILKR
ncbi:MAG: T9SS type A sorting domain-containing protein [Candidatus Kapaibacteriota bacterium]